MHIFSSIIAGAKALRKGGILLHPARWKSAQAVSMALVAISVPAYHVICSSADVCAGIREDDVSQVAALVGAIAFAAFQIWVTIASSEKVGFGKLPTGAAGDGRPPSIVHPPLGSAGTEKLQAQPGRNPPSRKAGSISSAEAHDYLGNFGAD